MVPINISSVFSLRGENVFPIHVEGGVEGARSHTAMVRIWRCPRDGCTFIISYVARGRGSLLQDSRRQDRDRTIVLPTSARLGCKGATLYRAVRCSVCVKGKKHHVNFLVTIVSNVRETS